MSITYEKEFLNLLYALQPSLLYSDGESTLEEVIKREAAILKKWATLEIKIGRTVSIEEACSFDK